DSEAARCLSATLRPDDAVGRSASANRLEREGSVNVGEAYGSRSTCRHAESLHRKAGDAAGGQRSPHNWECAGCDQRVAVDHQRRALSDEALALLQRNGAEIGSSVARVREEEVAAGRD